MKNKLYKKEKKKIRWNEFSHRYACWANNHNGWAKMKQRESKRIKRKEKRKSYKEWEDDE